MNLSTHHLQRLIVFLKLPKSSEVFRVFLKLHQSSPADMSAIARNPIHRNLTTKGRAVMMADYAIYPTRWGCGKVPFLELLSDQDDWASTTIQRFFRGSKVRFFEPRQKQMVSHPLGRITLKGNLAKINSDHELWGQNGSPFAKPNKRCIGFAKGGVERRDTENKEHVINYHEGRNKPSRLFAETICSVFSISNKPLLPIFLHDNASSLQPLFDDTISKLEAGLKVDIWDGQSTKLKPTALTIDMVKECRVKYEYFMLQEDQAKENQAKENQAKENQAKEVESLMKTLSEMPLSCTVTPLYEKENDDLEFDDLELRLMKLMNL